MSTPENADSAIESYFKGVYQEKRNFLWSLFLYSSPFFSIINDKNLYFCSVFVTQSSSRRRDWKKSRRLSSAITAARPTAATEATSPRGTRRLRPCTTARVWRKHSQSTETITLSSWNPKKTVRKKENWVEWDFTVFYLFDGSIFNAAHKNFLFHHRAFVLSSVIGSKLFAVLFYFKRVRIGNSAGPGRRRRWGLVEGSWWKGAGGGELVVLGPHVDGRFCLRHAESCGHVGVFRESLLMWIVLLGYCMKTCTFELELLSGFIVSGRREASGIVDGVCPRPDFQFFIHSFL